MESQVEPVIKLPDAGVRDLPPARCGSDAGAGRGEARPRSARRRGSACGAVRCARRSPAQPSPARARLGSAAPGAGLNASAAGSGLPEEVPEYWQGRRGPPGPARGSRAGRSHVCGQMLRRTRGRGGEAGTRTPAGRASVSAWPPRLGREQRPLGDSGAGGVDLLVALPAQKAFPLGPEFKSSGRHVL